MESAKVYDFGEPRIMHRPGRRAVLQSFAQDGLVDIRMTEYADKSDEQLASEFIISTCQLLPKSVSTVSDQRQNYMFKFYPIPEFCSILCGSLAEFYIRPLNTCIGDSDVLMSSTSDLVFSGDNPVPPYDMSGLSDMISCYKIDPYEKFPGFVRFLFWRHMNYNWKSKTCEYCPIVNRKRNRYGRFNMERMTNVISPPTFAFTGQNIVRGPAIKHPADSHLGGDIVYSVWCPHWPKEAQAWIDRPRSNGWPTIDTITEVKESGCHVVYVQHRSCRDDKEQWRFSFSVAEVILLQSWTKIQQIVYHLLRFFGKRQLMPSDCPREDEVLCTYHIKTLMLWTCEKKSPEWWNSTSVFAVCCNLLQKLSKWLTKRRCRNYFIPEANLFHEPSSSQRLDQIQNLLNNFNDSEKLCHWFIENYILPITRTNVEVESTLKGARLFVNFMLRLFDFWKVSETKTLDLLVALSFDHSHKNSREIIKSGQSFGLRRILRQVHVSSRITEPKVNGQLIDLPTIQNVSCCTYYDFLLNTLHVSYSLGCGEISWDRGPAMLLLDFVNAISKKPTTLRSKFHNFPKAYTAPSSLFQFVLAQDLMQNLTGSNGHCEFKLVSLMSKEVLRKALEYDALSSNGIAPAAFASLAALHIATCEFQHTLRYSLDVFADNTPRGDAETLNAGCFLFIDDVARIVGLWVLQNRILNSNLHCIHKSFYLDLRLSPDVFAHYLIGLSAERIPEHIDVDYVLPSAAFPIDDCVKALGREMSNVSMRSETNFSGSGQSVYCSTDLFPETEDRFGKPFSDKETVIDILMYYALENMTSFYGAILADFGIQCNTADCYRASYLYKCRKYDDVQQLCEQILREPDLQSHLKEISFANVVVFPPLDSFFDEDVQSLLGCHTLFYYITTPNEDIQNVELNEDSTFEHWVAQLLYYYRNELSLFLQSPYSMKRYYFLGRHFLARYLKVRCCIDCNLPCAEAITEFATQRIGHPFESIIASFIRRKYRLNFAFLDM